MNENRVIVDDVQIDEPVDEPVNDMQAEKTTPANDMVWKDQITAREGVKEGQTPWLKAEEIDNLKSRWNSVQIEFVDDPQASIKQADELVSEAIERFQQALHDQRKELVERWNNQEDVSTEDLRVGLQNYRSFLDHLLTMKATNS